MCLGRAERALQIATEWAATREQFGQSLENFKVFLLNLLIWPRR